MKSKLAKVLVFFFAASLVLFSGNFSLEGAEKAKLTKEMLQANATEGDKNALLKRERGAFITMAILSRMEVAWIGAYGEASSSEE